METWKVFLKLLCRDGALHTAQHGATTSAAGVTGAVIAHLRLWCPKSPLQGKFEVLAHGHVSHASAAAAARSLFHSKANFGARANGSDERERAKEGEDVGKAGQSLILGYYVSRKLTTFMSCAKLLSRGLSNQTLAG